MTLRNKLAITGIGLGLISLTSSHFVSDSVRTRITDAETKGDTYLIYTEAGTFQNTDAWYRGKFSSSDMQGEAKQHIGKEVEIQKYGWRIPVISGYGNQKSEATFLQDKLTPYIIEEADTNNDRELSMKEIKTHFYVPEKATPFTGYITK